MSEDQTVPGDPASESPVGEDRDLGHDGSRDGGPGGGGVPPAETRRSRRAAGAPPNGESTSEQARPGRRRPGRSVVVGVWELLLEVVFFALVVLVSWLVYEEVRWPFVATVFLGVNAVLLALLVIGWLRRRRRTRRRHP